MLLTVFCGGKPMRSYYCWNQSVRRITKTTLRIMQWMGILLLACSCTLSANTNSQTVSLSAKNMKLDKVFSAVSQQTGYHIACNYQLIENAPPLTLELVNATIEATMETLLAGRPLEYTIRSKTIFIKSKTMPKTPSIKDILKDQLRIVGRVTNAEGQPIAGVSVIIKGTTTGTTTNAEGYFVLNVQEGQTLVISSVQYDTQEVGIDQSIRELTIVLKASISNLQEVVVNKGYYTESKKLATGNVSTVSASEIEKQPVSNPLAAMQGRMAGVHIVQNSGVAGTGFAIQIRGRNSIRTEANNPLYIIDGIPFATEDLRNHDISARILGSYGPSPLNSINPIDIESIEILKDADATAIYGSRGANGVVLITTKKGKAGKLKVSANAFTGASKVARLMKLMNTEQYLEMRREAHANDGATTYPSWAYDVNGTWDSTRYTDWQKVLIGRTAKTQQAQVGLSGGNEQTQFLISSTIFRQTTVFPGDFEYKKGAVHLNLRHRSADKKFSMELSSNYVLDNNNQIESDLTRESIRLEPNAPALYTEDGALNWANSTWENPLRHLVTSYQGKSNALFASLQLRYQLPYGFYIKINGGFNSKAVNETNKTPSTIYDPAYGLGSEYASLQISSGNQQSWQMEPQLGWEYNWGKSRFSALAGSTFQDQTHNMIYMGGYGFPSNALIGNIAAATYQYIINNTDQIYRYNALFGRINYSFDEKYIVNITGRRDGSSRFGPGKHFGNFGAVGLAWLFHEEAFLSKLSPVLSFGKIRASYGTTGSDQIGNYQFLDTYVLSNRLYEGLVGLSPSRLYNPLFGWESNRKFEVALEIGLWSDRLFLSTAYFRNRSSNQLVGIPLPGTTGFPSIQANLDATVQNTGYEVELRTVNLTSKKLRWTTSLNLTVPNNKLIDFPNLASSTYAAQYEIGQPLDIRKVYHYTGIDKATGLFTFLDVNGDGQFTGAEDRKTIIRTNVRYFGGLTNTFSVGGFQLDFLFQYVKQTGSNYFAGGAMPGLRNNQPVSALNRWQRDGDEAWLQRYSTGSDAAAYNIFSRYQFSDAVLSDASFIRLKNLSLSYNFPAKWLSKGSCNVYLQGQNLLTFTQYEGADPEIMSVSTLPPLRVITAGFSFSL